MFINFTISIFCLKCYEMVINHNIIDCDKHNENRLCRSSYLYAPYLLDEDKRRLRINETWRQTTATYNNETIIFAKDYFYIPQNPKINICFNCHETFCIIAEWNKYAADNNFISEIKMNIEYRSKIIKEPTKNEKIFVPVIDDHIMVYHVDNTVYNENINLYFIRIYRLADDDISVIHLVFELDQNHTASSIDDIFGDINYKKTLEIGLNNNIMPIWTTSEPKFMTKEWLRNLLLKNTILHGDVLIEEADKTKGGLKISKEISKIYSFGDSYSKNALKTFLNNLNLSNVIKIDHTRLNEKTAVTPTKECKIWPIIVLIIIIMVSTIVLITQAIFYLKKKYRNKIEITDDI